MSELEKSAERKTLHLPRGKGDKECETWMLTSALAVTGIYFSETQFLALLNKEIGAGHWFSNFFPLISRSEVFFLQIKSYKEPNIWNR